MSVLHVRDVCGLRGRLHRHEEWVSLRKKEVPHFWAWEERGERALCWLQREEKRKAENAFLTALEFVGKIDGKNQENNRWSPGALRTPETPCASPENTDLRAWRSPWWRLDTWRWVSALPCLLTAPLQLCSPREAGCLQFLLDAALQVPDLGWGRDRRNAF